MLRHQVDERIANVVKAIVPTPHERHLAQECAERIHLSLTRFVHLFSPEVGTSFRRFRVWKRARGLLDQVLGSANLTEITLETGFVCSAHFSKAIRGAYGIRPSDLVAGLRHMPPPPYRVLAPAGL